MAKPVPPAAAQAQRSGSWKNRMGFQIVALCRGNDLGRMYLQGSAAGGCNFVLQIHAMRLPAATRRVAVG
jgi:hypothetical protein